MDLDRPASAAENLGRACQGVAGKIVQMAGSNMPFAKLPESRNLGPATLEREWTAGMKPAA